MVDKLNNLQENCIAGIRSGLSNPLSINGDERNFDFFDVKADMFALIERYGLGPQRLSLTNEAPNYYHPTRKCAFKLGKVIVGYYGQLHPQLVTNNALGDVISFELFYDRLPELRSKNARPILQLSEYQAVDRDFAFIVDAQIKAAELVKIVKNTDKELIETVDIFDIYTGQGIEENKKSVAIRIRLQPKQQTLSETEIEEISDKIIKAVHDKLAGVLRDC